MENKIVIKFNEREKVEIDSDTPQFDSLVNYIVLHLDDNYDNIQIEVSDNKFDKEIFKASLIQTIKEVVGQLKINKEKYDNSLKSTETLFGESDD